MLVVELKEDHIRSWSRGRLLMSLIHSVVCCSLATYHSLVHVPLSLSLTILKTESLMQKRSRFTASSISRSTKPIYRYLFRGEHMLLSRHVLLLLLLLLWTEKVIRSRHIVLLMMMMRGKEVMWIPVGWYYMRMRRSRPWILARRACGCSHRKSGCTENKIISISYTKKTSG
jgi:hypothetical protein